MAISIKKSTVAFIGCGSMASAIAGGAVRSGAISAERLGLANRTASRADDLAKSLGGARSFGCGNVEAATWADVIVLATKPNVAPVALADVAAGITARRECYYFCLFVACLLAFWLAVDAAVV
jgi:pyrroline-5-carboxylate reductase